MKDKELIDRLKMFDIPLIKKTKIGNLVFDFPLRKGIVENYRFGNYNIRYTNYKGLITDDCFYATSKETVINNIFLQVEFCRIITEHPNIVIRKLGKEKSLKYEIQAMLESSDALIEIMAFIFCQGKTPEEDSIFLDAIRDEMSKHNLGSF